MIYLSVDYGAKRTGIAVSDQSAFLASPVTVIHEAYVPNLLNEIAKIATDRKVDTIVVGFPKNMDGTVGEKGKLCESLSHDIEQLTGIKTILWDERLTTVSAHQALNTVNVKGKKRKNVVDAVAATMILQSYLDYRRNHND